MNEGPLRQRIVEIGARARLTGLAVAVHDLETGRRFAHEPDQWFHAASTFKAAILFALLRAGARLEDQLHVRNLFHSVAEGAPPYRIDAERDGEQSVHRHTGRTLTLRYLATKMITRSSNLATNLLLDYLTPKAVRARLAEAGVKGLQIRRGVEDLAAHDLGINNEVTAAGLVRLYEIFPKGEGMEMLLAQEFNGMIPAQLPKHVLVAHKTGEISTHAHDAGLVLPPGQRPYALAILTQSEAGQEGRQKAVAEISHAIYEEVCR